MNQMKLYYGNTSRVFFVLDKEVLEIDLGDTAPIGNSKYEYVTSGGRIKEVSLQELLSISGVSIQDLSFRVKEGLKIKESAC